MKSKPQNYNRMRVKVVTNPKCNFIVYRKLPAFKNDKIKVINLFCTLYNVPYLCLDHQSEFEAKFNLPNCRKF